MSSFLPILLLVLMVAIFASLMREGLWSNLLTLINVLFAALIATNVFEPVATLLTSFVASGTMFWDFFALWGSFAAAFALLRLITDRASRFRVKFKTPVEMAGCYLFALWTAYVFVAFASMTLHTAPLGREFMWKGFRAEDPIFFGMKPDRQWLGFVHMVSQGSLARMADETDPEKYVFDRRGEFMPKYATRRGRYEMVETVTGLR